MPACIMLTFDDESMKNLNKLVGLSGEMRPEPVIVKALSLYWGVLKETGLGGVLLIRREDGEEVEIILPD